MENKIVNEVVNLLPEQSKEKWSTPDFNLISISNGTLGKEGGGSDFATQHS